MSTNDTTLGVVESRKILLYGATGMLGTRIRELLREDFKIVGPPHSHLNLLDKAQIIRNLTDVSPDKVIYCAGITKIDYAQEHPKEAYRMNADVVFDISKVCAKLDIPIYYISTDAVFGEVNSKKPFKEADRTKPLSVYGASKLKGEEIVLAASDKNAVVRTVMIYAANYPHRLDFARAVYESLKNRIPFAGIVDQEVNPTFVDDIVHAISVLLKNNARGIYHVASTDHLTNYQFVCEIADVFGFDKNLIVKTTFDKFFAGKKAPRARYSVLNTIKFRKKFGNNILQGTRKSIKDFKKQLDALESLPIDI